MDFGKLQPYRRQIRPVAPESLPTFLDGELRRLDNASREIVEALKSLDARLRAVEP